MTPTTGIEQIRLISPDGRLTADFSPTLGAEMTSLRLRHAGSMHELLYRGGDLRPTQGWTGRAPMLWPVIGRTYPPGPPPDKARHRNAPLGWEHGGAVYPMPHHGFARSVPWRVNDRSPAHLRMVLEDGPETRRCYPFGFSLALDAELDDDGIRLACRVSASAGNTAEMPFTLGNHITFQTPLVSGAMLASTTVRCEGTRRHLLDDIGRPCGLQVEEPLFHRPIAVTALRPLDVVVLGGFGDQAVRASLEDESGVSVCVSQAVTGRAGDAPLLLTLWGDPPSGYLSLEPWLGLPNALSSGRGRALLEPGEFLDWRMEVSVADHRRPERGTTTCWSSAHVLS